MLESPLIQEIVVRARHRDILRVLKARFGPVPPNLDSAVQEIGAASQLDKLVDFASTCSDLESFHARVQSVVRRQRRIR